MSKEPEPFPTTTIRLPGSGKEIEAQWYSWDWKDQPEAETLMKIMMGFKNHKPYIQDVSAYDGGDDYVWLFSSEFLSEEEAEQAFDLLMELEAKEDEDDN